MNSINYLRGVFHLLIIAIFLFSLSACGYKAPPYYLEDASLQEAEIEDENVEFILKEKKSTSDK